MRLRRPRVALIVLLLLGLGLAALSVLAGLGKGPQAPAPASPTRETTLPARTTGPELVEPGAQDAPQQVESPVPVERLICRSAVDRKPLAGVHLYAEARAVAGPSDEDGALVIPDSVHSQRLQAWAPGWVPTRLPGRDPSPEEVLLEPATAAVQLWVRSADPGLRIVRTRLVPTGTPTRSDQPWAPRLTKQGPLVAGASQLPAGGYHVYVWAASDGDHAPRALPRQEVELQAGRTLTVEIDADAPREAEPDG